MSSALIYTRSLCSFCNHAKHILLTQNITYKEVSIDGNDKLKNELIKKTGRKTVPQIWIDGKYIGGCDDLIDWIADQSMAK